MHVAKPEAMALRTTLGSCSNSIVSWRNVSRYASGTRSADAANRSAAMGSTGAVENSDSECGDRALRKRSSTTWWCLASSNSAGCVQRCPCQSAAHMQPADKKQWAYAYDIPCLDSGGVVMRSFWK